MERRNGCCSRVTDVRSNVPPILGVLDKGKGRATFFIALEATAGIDLQDLLILIQGSASQSSRSSCVSLRCRQ